MNCDELVEQLTDYLDGALDPAAQQRVAEHLDSCDGCQRYSAQFAATLERLREQPPPELDPNLRLRVLDAFRSARPTV